MAASIIEAACDRGGSVYVFGNGGSAATASHLAVDLGRNVRVSDRHLRVYALNDNVPWLTAVSNDQHFDECFAEPLRRYLTARDMVIGISASGASENVIRGFEVARDRGAVRLALIGFDGGRLAGLASHSIWVDSRDYGVVESVHLAAVHGLVRALLNRRQRFGGRVGVESNLSTCVVYGNPEPALER